MRSVLRNRQIVCQDPDGNPYTTSYDNLLIDLGERRGPQALFQCLLEEEERVARLEADNVAFQDRIRRNNEIYKRQPRDSREWHAECRRRTAGIDDVPPHRRIELLREYFCVDHQHRWLIEDLFAYLMAGTEEDHGGYLKTLIRFALDYIMSVMSQLKRRNGHPAAMHSIAAARGAASNGQSAVTIIGTLLHDVLEERLDAWTKEMLSAELAKPEYSRWAGIDAKNVPPRVRREILVANQDRYNDRAAQIYYSTALRLYDHVRKFPQPERYFQMVHSIMEVIARLSRTRDLSYYQYLQRFFYPEYITPDDISRATLLEQLDREFEDAGALLDEYRVRVDNFYRTPYGDYAGGDEMKRNALREIIGKILDRLHNTRDMERKDGFSVPERIYGAGFKNIYFAQALEDRMVEEGNLWTEGRIILSKFIKKPKIAALYQLNVDLDYLAEQEFKGHPGFGPGTIAELERDLERYKATGAFSTLTPASEKSFFDGTIDFFNRIILGQRGGLAELSSDLRRQAAYLLAFRAVFEELLVTSAEREKEADKTGCAPCDACWKHFRVQGMGPSLGEPYQGSEELPPMDVKSFQRWIR